MTAQPLIKNPESLESLLKEIPPVPGVYLMREEQGNILYIGKSKKLRSRVRSYFRDSERLSQRIALMVQQITDIEFIVTDTEAEALALEANLVKQHQPYYNVLLKDDKKYPYVCITWSEDYPRIFITRKRQLKNPKDKYFGPYVDSQLLRQTLQLIYRIFPLRQRRQPLFKERPCLNYDLGRCPGVCQTLITPSQYRQIVTKVQMIFQGRMEELIATLNDQMEKAALDLNFEQAAIIRDQIKNLASLNPQQKVAESKDTTSRDAIALAADAQHCCIQIFQMRGGHLVGRLGFFAAPLNPPFVQGAILQQVLEEHYWMAEPVEIPSEILLQYELPDGEIMAEWLSDRLGKKVNLIVPQRQKKAELIEMVAKNAQYELERHQRFYTYNTQAMEDLAAILDLPALPRRIEGYDISHIQGSNAVASQVVFIDGVPAKQHYRHYKIKNPTVKIGHSDDFVSLAEVISRRFHQYNPDTENKPNLIMIDGGKGQLSAVVEILQQMNLLSELQVCSLAKQREEIFLPGETEPLPTNSEQSGVQLLRRVRDEAHRFAVSFHRQQRQKTAVISQLDDIPGLGFQRQKQLLAHFGSLDYIRQASAQKLAQVSGIGSVLAQGIYDYFHPADNN
ncbi:MAG: excinuclease ABC subunit UvrC [Gomphosphaeria aponina SAG 52.96 = DSM 107014]|uniref:UvrABC system protein C n=1 Tax=Gomphosphaeria aponina SAG 52.96 = DSM 107014 TaxID=1521640 RepID=A0A941GXN9_9CHRO|nr:excinuclease ABC subunit UvrC [Gomphosphaeria aponina SAG 52.96 = DSM 107014]